MEAVWLPHPGVWIIKRSAFPITLRMGLISSVLIASRLGLINCSQSLEWACMHSMKLCCIISVGILLVLSVFYYLRG